MILLLMLLYVALCSSSGVASFLCFTKYYIAISFAVVKDYAYLFLCISNQMMLSKLDFFSINYNARYKNQFQKLQIVWCELEIQIVPLQNILIGYAH